MSTSVSRTSHSLSSRILERIQEGRCSSTKYASADMFVGPCIGRRVSTVHLESLSEDIYSPERYHSWEPLLAVRHTEEEEFLKGKLIIIGGGHRLCVSTLTVHTLVLPYKLVPFVGLGQNGRDLDVLEYGGLIMFNVEATEPRPQEYSFMQQVMLYGNLKLQWQDMEKLRVSKLKGRKRIPRCMSHRNLFEFYEQQSELCGSQSRWAIGFLSGNEIKQSTRRNYMSGADRLLDAGVVPYLCHLESTANACFSRASLNAVRNWSVGKVRDVVELWRVRKEADVKVHYAFLDKIGREVDGKGRGRKGPQKVSSQGQEDENLDRHGDEDSVQQGSPITASQSTQSHEECVTGDRLDAEEPSMACPVSAHLPVLQTSCEAVKSLPPNLSNTGTILDDKQRRDDISRHMHGIVDEIIRFVVKDSEKESVDGVLSRLIERRAVLMREKMVDVDLESSIAVAEKVKENIESCTIAKETAVSQTLDEIVNQVLHQDKKEIRLVGEGGILGTKITLCQSDLSPIEKFSLANDRSVTFTFSFLTRWSLKNGSSWMFLDSIVSSGWWATVVLGGTSELEKLETNMLRFGMSSVEKKKELWNSELCLMPICGKGHWSLVVIVVLGKVHRVLKEQSKEGVGTKKRCRKAKIYFVDSIGSSSPHATVADNIYHFLRATYPGDLRPTLTDLFRVSEKHCFMFAMQKGLDCGFYVTYHMCILSRIVKDLLYVSPAQIEVLIRGGHASYTFQQYESDLKEQLRLMVMKYDGMQSKVRTGCWVWGQSCNWGLQDMGTRVVPKVCEENGDEERNQGESTM